MLVRLQDPATDLAVREAPLGQFAGAVKVPTKELSIRVARGANMLVRLQVPAKELAVRDAPMGQFAGAVKFPTKELSIRVALKG